MKVTGNASVGDSPDVLAFDDSLRRLYVSAESGVVAVFAEHATSLRSSARRFSRPTRTPSRSTRARTSSTSRSRAGRTASRSC